MTVLRDAEMPLAAGFPHSTPDTWRALVKGVLVKAGAAGRDTPVEAVEDLLTSQTHDGVRIRPLYTAADAAPVEAGMPGLAPFTRGSRPQGATVDGWDVRARHAHPDAKTTAQAVLADLENGATSLWLALGDGALPVPALPDALADVLLDLAPIVLDAGGDAEAAAAALFALAADRGVPPSELAGNLGADPFGRAARTGGAPDVDAAVALAIRCARGYPGLRAVVVDAIPYHEAGGGDAEELGLSVAAGVACLRALTAAGLDLEAALGQLEFRYAATADQFATIAKLRAARRLWARVAQVCGAPAPSRAQRQHAVTSPAMMTRRDPWVNMLRVTLACFGAGVGGADAVTVAPFDAELGLPDDFARRIARNTQTVLQEEANLTRVVDPAGGSWYVESLTDALARAAWAVFTEVERAGGMAAALASGLVRARLDATWARRADAVAHRADAITGLSEFPNLGERLPARPPAPAPAGAGGPGPAGGGLPRRRHGEAFEALRAASDARLEAAGARPRVFLAALGPLAAHSARLAFAANLFAAGGMDAVVAGAGHAGAGVAGPGDDAPESLAAAFAASGARVACLCASDEVYADSAAPVARALKAAGAGRLWAAGKPGERAAADAAAGVDGYVFTGCNAVEVLRTALAEAGAS
jgi:methylmalonyl-CoA mutase